MKKGDLLRNKNTGEMATIIREPWTKLFRDDSDWEAMRYGGDYGTAATAIRVVFHKNGSERTYKRSEVSRFYEIVGSADFGIDESR